MRTCQNKIVINILSGKYELKYLLITFTQKKEKSAVLKGPFNFLKKLYHMFVIGILKIMSLIMSCFHSAKFLKNIHENREEIRAQHRRIMYRNDR